MAGSGFGFTLAGEMPEKTNRSIAADLKLMAVGSALTLPQWVTAVEAQTHGRSAGCETGPPTNLKHVDAVSGL